MKHRLAAFFSLLLACNSVTVVPIDDEDAGDGGADASSASGDASTDVIDAGSGG